jgi:ABC-2 type transport system permease protein
VAPGPDGHSGADAAGGTPATPGDGRAGATATDGGTALDTTGHATGGGLLGVGFRSLLKREVLRFVRRPRNTFVPPAITNVLYFAVFGVILGSRIDDIAGVKYLLFILPGLVVLGAISNAFENASFSIFHGRWNEYIHEALTSPLSYTSMVLAYIAASALRGILVGIIIAGVGFVFLTATVAPIGIARPGYLVAFGLVITVLFASFGVVGGLWARDFDYLTVMNQFIIRPLVFFGGVFYSLDVLPEPYRTLSLLNPMVYMVNGVRYGFLGYADIDPNLSLAVLSGLAAAIVALDVALFRRGYGLVD